MPALPLVDLLAFVAFVALWVGYTVMAEHRTLLGKSLSAVMTRHRFTWMRAVCERDNRVADTALLGNLMRSVAFFASATLLVLGGLVALVGSGERAYSVFRDLPFADHEGGIAAFEVKVVLLASVFVYTFFQITWSLRQFNYCCILLGIAPLPSAANATKEAFAKHAARLQALAANSFNRGLRAYYFALAMLLWFVSGWAFLAATLLVSGVLYRREFHSRSLRTLKGIVDL